MTKLRKPPYCFPGTETGGSGAAPGPKKRHDAIGNLWVDIIRANQSSISFSLSASVRPNSTKFSIK